MTGNAWQKQFLNNYIIILNRKASTKDEAFFMRLNLFIGTKAKAIKVAWIFLLRLFIRNKVKTFGRKLILGFPVLNLFW
jgi:hypothetical protein